MYGSKHKKFAVPPRNSEHISNLPSTSMAPISSKISTNPDNHKLSGTTPPSNSILSEKAKILDFLQKINEPSHDAGKDGIFKEVRSKSKIKLAAVPKTVCKTSPNTETRIETKSYQKSKSVNSVRFAADPDNINSCSTKIASNSDNLSSPVMGHQPNSISVPQSLSYSSVTNVNADNASLSMPLFTHGIVTGFSDYLTPDCLKSELSCLLSSLNCNQSLDDLLMNKKCKVRVSSDKSFSIIFPLAQQTTSLPRHSMLEGNVRKLKMCTFRQQYYVTHLSTLENQLVTGSHDNVGIIQGIQGLDSEFNTKAREFIKLVNNGCLGSTGVIIPCPILIRSGFSSAICANDNSKRGKSNPSC